MISGMELGRLLSAVSDGAYPVGALVGLLPGVFAWVVSEDQFVVYVGDEFLVLVRDHCQLELCSRVDRPIRI